MSRSDKELLELAAKAAGIIPPITLYQDGSFDFSCDRSFKPAGGIGGGTDLESWNPLAEDGDALRLAVDLNIGIDVKRVSQRVTAYLHPHIHCNEGGDDLYAATRRAIVRAAAEIGKSMP